MVDTIQSVLLAFLRMKAEHGAIIHAHNIEDDLVGFARQSAGMYHNPSAYSREFRRLRNKPDLIKAEGLELIPVEAHEHTREKAWKVIRTGPSSQLNMFE